MPSKYSNTISLKVRRILEWMKKKIPNLTHDTQISSVIEYTMVIFIINAS